MANLMDRIVAEISQASCSVYENQSLCKAARHNDEIDKVVERQKEERERLDARQRELADIRERARKLTEAIEKNPKAAEKYFNKIGLKWDKEKISSQIRFKEAHNFKAWSSPRGWGPLKRPVGKVEEKK